MVSISKLIMKFDSTYFENHDCEYYPCHDTDSINCLFCYCPLYFMQCPGVYTMLGNVKDCSKCTITHNPNKGWKIVQKYLQLQQEKKL